MPLVTSIRFSGLAICGTWQSLFFQIISRSFCRNAPVDEGFVGTVIVVLGGVVEVVIEEVVVVRPTVVEVDDVVVLLKDVKGSVERWVDDGTSFEFC